jgi:P4 family phage/plasmid primase-like protien
LIDLDAPLLDGTKRPKGVSASDAELALCENTAKEVAVWLEDEMGFAKAIRGFSGNGYHLMYRLPDLPNDDEHKLIIKNAMAALAEKFGKDTIDVTVVNPGRIWKYYGTTGRKGDSTTERPHRKSYLFKGQPEPLGDVPVTPLETLKKLAALLSSPSDSPESGTSENQSPVPAVRQGQETSGAKHPASGQTRPMEKSDLGPLDMERYLTHYGISFNVKATADATLYRLDKCLFNPDHGKNDASIVVPKKGAIKYQCFHSSCQDRKWKDAKQIISGGDKLAQFCTGYDPNWKPPQQITGPGDLADMPTDRYSMMNEVTPCVPLPEKIDPRWLYEKKGRRPVFVPKRLVNYVANYLRPIRHTAGLFYRYDKGNWQIYDKTEIATIIDETMKEEIQAAWIDNALKILSARVNLIEKKWPNNPTLINLKNGVLNLENINNIELLPHDPVYGLRGQLPVSYKPDAICPNWRKFLKQIFPEDANDGKKFLLQQFFGYTLLRDCRFHVCLFMYGTGRNGKSTVLDVLKLMLGSENVSNMSLADLSERFRPAFLVGKMVNMARETNAKTPTMTELFKNLVTGEEIDTERKYGEQFTFRPYAKLMVAMNEPPVIPDKTPGFSERVIVLNFLRRFAKEEQTSNLYLKLGEEIDGIFIWALEGVKFLLGNDGFAVADEVARDTAQFLTTLNPVLIFAQECLQFKEGLFCYNHDLWSAYKAWCNYGKNRPLGRNKFLDQMTMCFPEKVKAGQEHGSGKRIHRGIDLNEEGEEYAARARRREERFGD